MPNGGSIPLIKRRKFFKSVSAVAGAAAFVAGERASAGERTVHPGHHYSIEPDSKFQSGVPRGKVFHFPIENPRAYPGMDCTIEVYVPPRIGRQRFVFDAMVVGFLLIGVLHVLNPDALIARTNLVCARQGQRFDAR